MNLDHFPQNIGITASHGGAEMPKAFLKRLHPSMQSLEFRRLLNFSDHGTPYLIPEEIKDDQVAIAFFSRAVGDPNRARDAIDSLRMKDFNDLAVWAKGQAPSPDEAELLKQQYYDPHHADIKQIITTTEVRAREYGQATRTAIINIHDTGNLLHGDTPDEDMPRPILYPQCTIGTRMGKACDPDVVQFFTDSIRKYIPEIEEIVIDIIDNESDYQGGYGTELYGEIYNQGLPVNQRFKRNVMELEINRELYMNEKNQKIYIKKAAVLKSSLRKAMYDLGIYLQTAA